MKSRLWKRLVMANMLVILTALLILGAVQSQLVHRYLFSTREFELKGLAREMEDVLADYLAGNDPPDMAESLLGALDRLGDARLRVVNLDGRIALSSHRPHRGRHLDAAEAAILGEVGAGKTITYQPLDAQSEERMLSVAHPISDDGRVIGALLVSAPVGSIQAAASEMTRLILVAAFAALVASAGLGFLLSRQVARPLMTMAEVASEMAIGRFVRSVPVTSDDELGVLARALNDLSRNLSDTLGSLKEEKQKFETTVASMREGVLGVESGGRIFLVNDAARQMLSLDTSAVGESFRTSGLPEVLVALIDRVRSGEVPGEVRIDLGPTRIYRVWGDPIQFEKRTGFSGVVILIQDISHAERLEWMRRNFVADASHELRAPLTVITGFLEALSDGTVSRSDHPRYIRIVREEVERLNRLVQGLLDLNRYESGHFELQWADVDSLRLLQSVFDRMTPLAHAQGIQFEIVRPSDPPKLRADRDRLEQVLGNLVENAIRYTPAGGRVELGVQSEADNVIFWVGDNGLGIAPDLLPHIWDRFFKADRSRRRDHPGSGIGLSIVRHIVTAHGGQVRVESSPGEGSLFEVRLPR